jgi:hypothetical protein
LREKFLLLSVDDQKPFNLFFGQPPSTGEGIQFLPQLFPAPSNPQHFPKPFFQIEPLSSIVFASETLAFIVSRDPLSR